MMKTAGMLIYGQKRNPGNFVQRLFASKKWWYILVCINLLRIENCGLLKLITVNQMLEDSRPLVYEYYHPSWFVAK